uniref:Uncharacterized protein n=1 Tax=Anguilla anguilla TaxID=7936 RepID=A0A0E9VA78_ANGAN
MHETFKWFVLFDIKVQPYDNISFFLHTDFNGV